jgi:glycosyltransferase involved in cell wall biosynthesis
MGEQLTVSVVIPAYNEEALIERTLERVTAYLRSMRARYDWEIVAVNDGSADRTGSLMDAFAEDEPRLTVVHHRLNTNLGKTLRDAFAVARGDIVVTLDCDLSYGPDHIGRLVDAMVEHEADIVIASPYIEGGEVTRVPKSRELLSRGANRLLTLSAKGKLTTVTGMVRAYRRGFLDSLNLKSLDFEVNTEIIYKAQLLRARIVEIPAHLDWSEQRDLGDSRQSSIRIARSIVSQAFSSFLFKPFAFFILPGLAVLAMALYSLGWSAYHTFEAWTGAGGTTFSSAVATAYQISPHSFVVGGVCLLVAIQLVSLGVLSAQNKRYFEELFYLGTAVYSIDRDAGALTWDTARSRVLSDASSLIEQGRDTGEPVEKVSGRVPNAAASEG